MSLKTLLEEHPIFVIGGLIIAAFAAGWGAQLAVIEASNQIVIAKSEYNELIYIKNGRTVSSEDKKHINKIVSLFNSKAFTNDLTQGENFKLMFKRFNEVRIELQKTRPLINNMVYANLIATAEKDMDYLISLSPWSVSELAGFDSDTTMNYEKDNKRLYDWSKNEGAFALSEMRAGRSSSRDEPLYFSELFNFTRKKQQKLIGLIETIERLHKNGILENA